MDWYEILQTFSYIIVSLYLFFALRKKCKLSTVLVSILIVNISITIFARLFWALENYKGFMNEQLGISDIFRLKLTAFKIIGVLIGSVIGIIILTKIYKNDKKIIINSATEAMFLGAGYTKVVCTIVGCCLGKIINPPWFGVYYRHLTSIYEFMVWFTGFALLHILKRKIKNDSTRISIVIIFYIIIRMFILEGLYYDGIFMGSTTARIIYFAVLGICITKIIINEIIKKENIVS